MTQGLELRGAVLGKGYRLGRKLDDPDQTAYEATHERIPGRFIVRLFPPEMLSQPEASSRIQRGARVASLLRDPHVIQVVDCSASGEIPAFVVLERMPGRSLAELMSEEGMLPMPRAMDLVDSLASALAAGHQIGLVHGDLRPAHVILPANGHPAAKLAGFGWAKELRAAVRVPAASGYLAPEQHFGKVLTLDDRVDQFGLAALAYEMVAACLPFSEESADLAEKSGRPRVPPAISELVPGVPSALDDVLRRALSFDPSQRHGSVLEFASALRAASLVDPRANEPTPPPQSREALGVRLAAGKARLRRKSGPVQRRDLGPRDEPTREAPEITVQAPRITQALSEISRDASQTSRELSDLTRELSEVMREVPAPLPATTLTGFGPERTPLFGPRDTLGEAVTTPGEVTADAQNETTSDITATAGEATREFTTTVREAQPTPPPRFGDPAESTREGFVPFGPSSIEGGVFADRFATSPPFAEPAFDPDREVSVAIIADEIGTEDAATGEATRETGAEEQSGWAWKFSPPTDEEFAEAESMAPTPPPAVMHPTAADEPSFAAPSFETQTSDITRNSEDNDGLGPADVPADLEASAVYDADAATTTGNSLADRAGEIGDTLDRLLSAGSDRGADETAEAETAEAETAEAETAEAETAESATASRERRFAYAAEESDGAMADAETAGDEIALSDPEHQNGAHERVVAEDDADEMAQTPLPRGALAQERPGNDITEELDISALSPVLDADEEEIDAALDDDDDAAEDLDTAEREAIMRFRTSNYRSEAQRDASLVMGSPGGSISDDAKTQIARSPFFEEEPAPQPAPAKASPRVEPPAPVPAPVPEPVDQRVSSSRLPIPARPRESGGYPVVLAPPRQSSQRNVILTRPAPPPSKMQDLWSEVYRQRFWVFPVAGAAVLLLILGSVYLVTSNSEPSPEAVARASSPGRRAESTILADEGGPLRRTSPRPNATAKAAVGGSDVAGTSPSPPPRFAAQVEPLPPRAAPPVAAAPEVMPSRPPRSRGQSGRFRRGMMPPIAVAETAPLGFPPGTQVATNDCSIRISSRPWAEVWIDGRNTGRKTPIENLQVACGTRKLQLKRPDRDLAQTQLLKVIPGVPYSGVYDLE